MALVAGTVLVTCAAPRSVAPKKPPAIAKLTAAVPATRRMVSLIVCSTFLSPSTFANAEIDHACLSRGSRSHHWLLPPHRCLAILRGGYPGLYPYIGPIPYFTTCLMIAPIGTRCYNPDLLDAKERYATSDLFNSGEELGGLQLLSL